MKENKILIIVVFIIFGVPSYLLQDAFKQVNTTYTHTTEAMRAQQEKRNYLTQMYNAARERSIILLKMVDTKDDFDLDDLNQELGEQARNFIQARGAFLQMSLSGIDKELLKTQNEWTLKTAPLQNQVADLLLEGKRDAAKKILFDRALPDQSYVLNLINKLIKDQSKNMGSTVNALSKGLDASEDKFLFISILLGTSSILVVIIVLTRTSKKESKWLQDQLEERKKNEEVLSLEKDKAEAATVAKTQFLATMSHEIRTPMNGVIGMAQLLEDTPLNNEQKDYLTTITRSGNSLLTIINDILDFSKLDADMAQLELIPFDLEYLSQECLGMVSGNLVGKSVEFILDYHPDCPRHFKGDPSRLRQVLMNLLGNAVKFTHQGFIRCGISCTDDGQLHIDIQDTGIGLKPKAIEHLFDEFTQADSSTTRQYGGTGLGLAISKKIVTLMDGVLGVESAFGRGTTFSIKCFLPKVAAPEPLKMQSLKGIRLLFIDDNLENCRIFKRIFEHMELDTTILSEPLQTLDVMTQAAELQKPYKIIVIDHNMPDKDGLELGTDIRQNHQFDKAKLLIFSSVGQKGDASIFSKAGFNAYLNKLSSYDLLKNMLSAMLMHTSEKPIITQYNIKEAIIPTPEIISFEGHILLVEDVLPNQLIAKKFLTKLGVTVDVVSDGQQAVEAYSDKSYDLIFMDCRMPVMDGYEATQAIRKIEQDNNKKAMPIIALTANASSDDRILCQQAGMNDVVLKPYKRADLSSCLEQWLNN